tara:strand:+ start:2530 stop:9888 length:7359 start_codon:yes stop_codon:yes gene_type:complete
MSDEDKGFSWRDLFDEVVDNIPLLDLGIEAGQKLIETGKELEKLPAGGLTQPILGKHFLNAGYNFVKAAGNTVALGAKEILYDGIILRNMGRNGTPMWSLNNGGEAFFQLVQQDILKDFVGVNFVDDEQPSEYTLFGPKGLGGAAINAVPEEVRVVLRDPIQQTGETWGMVINQLVDNPLSVAFTLMSAAGVGFTPEQQAKLIAEGNANPLRLFDIDEWKQAIDIVYRGDRSMGQSLAANLAGIDPFDENAYNSIEAEWWFDLISGTADFAKEIFLDPVERGVLGTMKVAKGATTIARVDETGKPIHLYRFGISERAIEQAVSTKSILIGPSEGKLGLQVVREADFYKPKSIDENTGLVKDDFVGTPEQAARIEERYRQWGIADSITKLTAENIAESKWFNDSLDTVFDAVPDSDFSTRRRLTGEQDNILNNDANLINRRITLGREAIGKGNLQAMPETVIQEIFKSPSKGAAKLELRKYLGDMSAKAEIDNFARQATDLIDNQDFKLGFENIENLETKVVKRTKTLNKQQTRANKLRELLAEKVGSKSKLVMLKARRDELRKEFEALAKQPFSVNVDDRLIRDGVQETAEQAEKRVRRNARQRVQYRLKQVEADIEDIVTSSEEELIALNRKIQKNESFIRTNKRKIDEEYERLFVEGEPFRAVNWQSNFDFNEVFRKSQQKKYEADGYSGVVTEIDPLDVLAPTDQFGLNILIDGLAEDLINSTTQLSRIGTGKINQPLEFIHRQNLQKLRADKSKDIAMQKATIPSTFEPFGFRPLRFITQRVAQGLINFDDLGGQAFTQYERMLTDAANQNFVVAGKANKILTKNELQELLGQWQRLSNAGADFVKMRNVYTDTVKMLSKRAEKIFIEADIRVYDSNNALIKIEEGTLNDWLGQAQAGFLNRVNKKTGIVQSLKRKKAKTVTADEDYLSTTDRRLRGKLTEKDLQGIYDEFGEDAVSITMVNENGVDVLYYDLSPSQLATSLVVPRWDLLGTEFSRITGESFIGARKPSFGVTRTLGSTAYGGMRNVWTAGKLLTPRWTARVLTDEKLRMAATFGMMKTLATLENGLSNYKQRLAANGLNWSEAGFEQAIRAEFKARYGDEFQYGDRYIGGVIDEYAEVPKMVGWDFETGKPIMQNVTRTKVEQRYAKDDIPKIMQRGGVNDITDRSGQLIADGGKTLLVDEAPLWILLKEAERLGKAFNAPIKRDYQFQTKSPDPESNRGYRDMAPDEGASLNDLSRVFNHNNLSTQLGDAVKYPDADYIVLHFGTDPATRWAIIKPEQGPLLEKACDEMREIIAKAKDNPDAEITVYRAVPKRLKDETINEFDWVTPSRSYAELFETFHPADHVVIQTKVKVKELVINRNRKNPRGEIFEFGYVPEKSPQFKNFIDAAIKKNIEDQKKLLPKYSLTRTNKYQNLQAASVVGRLLAGSIVNPLAGLAWAGRHWQSRTKVVQQLAERNASQTLATAYEDAAQKLIDDNMELQKQYKTEIKEAIMSQSTGKAVDTLKGQLAALDIQIEEYRKLAKLVKGRTQKVRDAFNELENRFGFALADKDTIVNLFDKAAVEWDAAGYGRLEIGNKTFNNAYGSDMRWHRLTKEQISSRRSTDGAVRGFFHAERELIQEKAPQYWNVYDLADAGASKISISDATKGADAWDNHYKQFSPTGPISKDMYTIIYGDSANKIDELADVIDKNPRIRERLGIQKYEGLEGDKQILKLIAQDILDEVNDLLPEKFFQAERQIAKAGGNVTWNGIKQKILNQDWQIKNGFEKTDSLANIIRQIRSKGYDNFGKGTGPAWMGTDQSIFSRLYRSAIDKGFENLGTMASDTISRQPFFEAAYTRNILESVQPYNKGDGTYDLSLKDIERIETEARKQAIKETRGVLYELAERTQFAEAVGFGMPFFNAYQEIIGRWASLAKQNPHMVGKGIYFISKDNYELPLIGLHQEQNEYGTETLVFRPADSQLADLFVGDLFKIASGIDVLPLSNTVGDALKTGITLDRDGLFSMISQTTPSFGPFITLPVREVMMGTGPLSSKPELEEIFGWMYPFGHPDGNFGERFLQELAPTWAKHAWYSTGLDWAGNTQSWDRTVLEQVAILDAQMRENGITPNYSDPSVVQDIVHEAQTRARNIGILRVFGSTLVPVAVDDASPFSEMITVYRELQDVGRSLNDSNFAEQIFLKMYGEEFFMLTGRYTNNNLGVNQTVSSWQLRQEFGDFIGKHPVLAPALTNSLKGSAFDQAEFSPIVRQMMLNNEDIEYKSPEEFIEDTEISRGWAEWNAWLDTPNEDLGEGSDGVYPTPNDVRYGRSGITPYLNADINSDLKFLFDLKEEELGLKYPLWAESKEEYQTPTFMRDLMKGLQDLLNEPSFGKKFNWWSDLVGEDGYLMERYAIQNALQARVIAGGSGDLTAESNTDLLLRWAKEQEEFATRPSFAPFFSRYLANDLVQQDSWMD